MSRPRNGHWVDAVACMRNCSHRANIQRVNRCNVARNNKINSIRDYNQFCIGMSVRVHYVGYKNIVCDSGAYPTPYSCFHLLPWRFFFFKNNQTIECNNSFKVRQTFLNFLIPPIVYQAFMFYVWPTKVTWVTTSTKESGAQVQQRQSNIQNGRNTPAPTIAQKRLPTNCITPWEEKLISLSVSLFIREIEIPALFAWKNSTGSSTVCENGIFRSKWLRRLTPPADDSLHSTRQLNRLYICQSKSQLKHRSTPWKSLSN